MKKIPSERNFVILLFVIAMGVFTLAQEDTRRAGKKTQDATVVLPGKNTPEPVSEINAAQAPVTTTPAQQ